MLPDFLLPLVGFAFVTSITPGPNNLMLMASGANFGVKRTVPHMLGVSLGHAFLTFVTGLGLAQAFLALPILRVAVGAAGVAYMLWLAWKIAHAAAPGRTDRVARPLSFLEAAAFQWVNPKAWAMSITAVTLYAPGDRYFAMFVVSAIFAAINLPSVTCWCLAGRTIVRWLDAPGRLRNFNWLLAMLLVVSIIPMLA